ncbi:SipW-dependent-type signal peptide-containing protein [Dietzia kunjamensis]|uniref:SipW-dependent-type signal peptide-containing protein n=1 Tax=Dietzia kunjamensis TaxID=322509 RepID=UPI002DBA2DBC|nr:SipW-dependent-type signal peptide-containing protein [Dietzia kunjamensis]MEB8325948.1 SipW-dependent-type signal peptide-containing protein [Dietzia kunjamensis]
MSTAPQTPQPAAKNQNRRKKVRAVMASGLVLGVGAAVTLAAWSDTAWGVGQFGSQGSDFNIQANFDGSTWGEFLTKDAAGTMKFGPASSALVPAQPVFQLVGLHETKGNLGADITVAQEAVASNELTRQVTVSIAELGGGSSAPTANCSAAASGVDFKPAGTLAAPLPTTTRVEKNDHKWLCLRAELSKDAGLKAAGIAPASVYWNFNAESDDAGA